MQTCNGCYRASTTRCTGAQQHPQDWSVQYTQLYSNLSEIETENLFYRNKPTDQNRPAGLEVDEETEDEDQQLENRKVKLDEKEQELDEKEQTLDERERECNKRKLELDNHDGENKKCKLELDERKLELDNREKELDKRKEENDGDDQLSNKQKLLEGMMQLAEESSNPLAVLAVKEIEDLLSTNNTAQFDQNTDKIDNVLQRFKSNMDLRSGNDLAYLKKEYCEVISILMASHSEDVTTKKAELSSNELHLLKNKTEKAVNEAKENIKQKLLVESSSKVVEEGESSLKEINTQLKTLYDNANEVLKKKNKDKFSAVIQTETEDGIMLEEDENAKAEWNNYIEKDHFANY